MLMTAIAAVDCRHLRSGGIPWLTSALSLATSLNQKKTVLVVKNQHIAEANRIFSESGVKLTTEGHRHLGAAIGTDDFKKKYVEEKIKKWIDDMTDLSKIAAEEPQIAFSAFTKGICHRWSFIQRTIPNIAPLFSPLEEAIANSFIPAVVGRCLSVAERKMVALPVRFGGLGITNPIEACEREYQSSLKITEKLSALIYNQDQDLALFDPDEQLSVIKEMKQTKESVFKAKYDEILLHLDPETQRCLELNHEKGSGSWLTVLPLQDMGYSLNKQEFRDALRLRYGWNVPNMPHFCGCGQKNTIDHTLICKKGGYVAMRHNNLRDLNIVMQKEVCRDVVSEPRLLPVNDDEVEGTTADRAAPDISSRGLWSTFERTFFDVRVLHPNAPSYRSSNLSALYRKHELEKMRKYNSRVITVERGSFSPLIYTTFGGMGPQATRYHKRLAEMVAHKRNENYNQVISHMRTRVRFSVLRSTLVAIRGERGKKPPSEKPLSCTSFNLIPNAATYD
jgi:hypothetical protein